MMSRTRYNVAKQIAQRLAQSLTAKGGPAPTSKRDHVQRIAALNEQARLLNSYHLKPAQRRELAERRTEFNVMATRVWAERNRRE